VQSSAAPSTPQLQEDIPPEFALPSTAAPPASPTAAVLASPAPAAGSACASPLPPAAAKPAGGGAVAGDPVAGPPTPRLTQRTVPPAASPPGEETVLEAGVASGNGLHMSGAASGGSGGGGALIFKGTTFIDANVYTGPALEDPQALAAGEVSEDALVDGLAYLNIGGGSLSHQQQQAVAAQPSAAGWGRQPTTEPEPAEFDDLLDLLMG